MTAPHVKIFFCCDTHHDIFLVLASLIAARKHWQLEAAPIDLGHSLINVACGQKMPEAILAQDMILTSPFWVECRILQAHRLLRTNVAASSVSLLFSGAALFICLFLTSQSG